MSRLPTPGQDNGNWGEILNDFLGQSHNADGSLKESAIPKSTNVTTDGSSDSKVPSVKAVKTYTDSKVGEVNTQLAAIAAQASYLMAGGEPSKNAFDGEVEYGTYSYTTGAKTDHASIIRNKNPIQVTRGCKIAISIIGGVRRDVLYIFQYAFDMTFIKYSVLPADTTATELQLEINTEYVNFRSQTEGDSGFVLKPLTFYSDSVYIEVSAVSAAFDAHMRAKAYEDALIGGDVKFIFATDLHANNWRNLNKYKFDLVKNAADYLNTDFVCFGGDNVVDGTSKASDINVMVDRFSVAKNIDQPSFILRGNHELGSQRWATAPETLIKNSDWRNAATRHFPETTAFDTANTNKAYYYWEHPQSKIRFIFLDTSDIENDAGAFVENPLNVYIKQKQFLWFQNVALDFTDKGTDKSNWAVVIFSHAGFQENDEGGLPNKALLIGVLNAFMTGGTYQATAGEDDLALTADVDFQTQGAMEFICAVSGHLHYDYVATFSALSRPSITVGSMLADNSATTIPGGAVRPVRNSEITNELFDIFTINRTSRTIKTTRIGAGSNRTVSF